MTVEVPPEVTEAAEVFELGDLLGRRPRSDSRTERGQRISWAAGSGVFGLLIVLSALPASGTALVLQLILGLVLLAAAVTLLVSARRFANNQLYIYREGIVLTAGPGRMPVTERWEDLQLAYRLKQTVPGAAPSGLPDGYVLFDDGRVVLRQTDPAGPTGQGTCQTVVRLSQTAREPVLLGRLRAGRPVSFGPLAAVPQGLAYQGMVIPWPALAAMTVTYETTVIAAAGINPLSVRTDLIRDLAVLRALVDRAPTDPAFLAPANAPADASAPGPFPPAALAGEYAPFRTAPNATAIVGTVLAVLFWPIGLLVSISGLRRSREPGGRGRELAVAGISIALLVGVISILVAASRLDHAATSNTAASTIQSSSNPGIPGSIDKPVTPPPGDLVPAVDAQDPGCAGFDPQQVATDVQTAFTAGNDPALAGAANHDWLPVEGTWAKATNPVLRGILNDATNQLSNIADDLNISDDSVSSSQVQGDVTGVDADMTAIETLCGTTS